MSDVGADIFAEWRVVPEYVVPFSVFMFVSNRWFVVLVSAFIKCLLVRTGGSVKILCGKKGMRVIC